MSNTSKEFDVSGDNRNHSFIHPESPGNPLSVRLQEGYSELLRYAVGMTGPDKQLLEGSGQSFQPINRSGVSSIHRSPVDQQQEWEPALSVQGNDGSGNCNSNAVFNTQQSRFKNISNGLTSGMNVNVNRNLKHDSSDSAHTHSTGTADVTYTGILEPALICLDSKLDSWLGKLKCDVLAEFKHLTNQALENQKCCHQREIQGIRSEKLHLQQEVNRLNELVNNNEQSMSRKDTVIDNVTQALCKQKDKVVLAQSFYQVRALHADTKREKFTEAIAIKFNKNRLTEKVLRAWFGLIQKNWKCRTEQLLEKKAQGVCKQLSLDYEEKIKALCGEIENMNKKLRDIQNEREHYALEVKKAFLRGMCALNMETMSAFTQEDTQTSPLNTSSDPDNSNCCNINKTIPSNYPQRDDFHTEIISPDIAVSNMPDTGSHFASLSVVGTSHPEQSKLRPSKRKVRPSTAPSSGASSLYVKAWGPGQSLAPPMASVVVERHDPVTKQTVGKATASRYPKYTTGKGSNQPKQKQQAAHSSLPGSIPITKVFHTYQPLAGQAMNITSGIKVVE